jgi:hypothetical protein
MFWGKSSVGGLKLCPLMTYLIIMGYRSKSALSTSGTQNDLDPPTINFNTMKQKMDQLVSESRLPPNHQLAEFVNLSQWEVADIQQGLPKYNLSTDPPRQLCDADLELFASMKAKK